MQMTASLKWITANAEKEMVNIARVTNLNPPENTPAGDARLLNYMAAHGHVSPFEMASMCIEIFAPRDISRQILRHRSFSFQEFSYRYSTLQEGMTIDREIRAKHPTNRQMSIELTDEHNSLKEYWESSAYDAVAYSLNTYKALADTNMAAPETIRTLLPEGFTMSHLYMTGSIRSWIFYIKERTKKDQVQYEHYLLAKQIEEIFKTEMPIIWEAFFGETNLNNELRKAKELLQLNGYTVFGPTEDTVINPFAPDSAQPDPDVFDEIKLYDAPKKQNFIKRLLSSF